ncbi:MAG TPA: histidine kinase [Trebonia sp.]|nr:histidine kinase [Trebonia sp.]
MDYGLLIILVPLTVGWTLAGIAMCLLIRALLVLRLRGPRRLRRAGREVGWGLALIAVSAVYLSLCGAYFRIDQAGAGNLFGATSYPAAVGWTLVTMLAVSAFAAVAPRQAGYLAAVAVGGLGLYLIYICAEFPVGTFDDEWYGWIPVGLDVQALAVLGTAALAVSFMLTRRTIVADIRAREAVLSARVDQLTETRAEAVDSAAAELRRLERDLHDGAQARLVALGINLRTAEKLIQTRPDEAMSLVAECRDTATLALSELRALVRGIYPPVLADRGLGDAVRALALECPVPAETDIQLVGRLPAPVESAVYFSVAEALSNAAKHAQATSVFVHVALAGGLLRAEVHDNGIGGADPRDGTGLAGLERRLAAFDGILAVSSPAGGPTIIAIEVPCVLSSPKTSIS